MPLTKAAWRQVWGNGPLKVQLAEEDEDLCFKRHQREFQTEQQLRHTYEKSINSKSRLHRNWEQNRADTKIKYQNLQESLYCAEESWDNRVKLNWEELSDDTAERIIIKGLFSPEAAIGSIATTGSVASFLDTEFANCKKSGKISLAEQRNLEMWVEAATLAVLWKQDDLLKSLPESLVKSCREVVDSVIATRTQNNLEPSKYLKPHRHCLTNGFIYPPLSNVDYPGKSDISKLDVKPHLALLRWFNSTILDSTTRKEWFVNTSKDQLRVREALNKRLLPSIPVGAKNDIKADMDAQENALRQLSQSEEKWRRVLNKKQTPLHAEQAHLLNSIPQPVVPKPFPTPDATKFTNSHFQEHLADLLCNPKYKKCLLVDPTDDFKSALYDLAWVISREKIHHIRSEQRKQANELTQRARRKVEVMVDSLMEREKEFFSIDLNTPDRTDYLYAPDKYSVDVDTATVNTKHPPFMSGGFKDTAIGVRV
eukprot:TRINITY_DN3598_c0_g1_i1.p1 TRINITY_DN3598_c0_g1~~TRINITY_DN3598_c0_g1_i1.p1  ORF type:complete len:525 (+),score=74.53 TRINITY_DN3598_c0_g1_i1:132-1577(+)